MFITITMINNEHKRKNKTYIIHLKNIIKCMNRNKEKKKERIHFQLRNLFNYYNIMMIVNK
jgi:hypothetical protein